MDNVKELINNFIKESLKCFGKEIALPSNQYFSIDQVVEEEKEGEVRYVIQYGYPQSGSVVIGLSHQEEKNTLFIEDVTVYAKKAGEDMIVANMSPQTQVGPITVRASFGVDMKTQKHDSLQEINANPNAIKMLELAASDLSQAVILGECRLAVPAGSTHIPYCDTRPYSPVEEKGKSI